ncbi:MAG: 50S ribosomal protein L18 [Kiritimatiellaeota bacterium]|nr:50S ribosomal protein L18 [Kiritimatiellota bacterium]
MAKLNRKEARRRRHRRVRGKVSGTAEIPRMSVRVTSKHLYVQFIDDEQGHTLAAASTVEPTFRESGQRADASGAATLGKLAAERALEKKISRVVFDRGGHKYHGRLKAIAEAAREAGLKF